MRWFGTTGPPDLSSESHTLAWHLSLVAYGEEDLYVMVNAYSAPLQFAVQVPGSWRVLVDTSTSRPPDLSPTGPALAEAPLTVQARSIVVLTGRGH